MSRDNTRVLESLFAFWRSQDVEGLLGLCTGDICYVVHAPPEMADIGACVLGKAELGGYLEAVCRAWDFLEVAPGRLYIEGDEIREVTRFKARLRDSGDELEGSKRHIWRFRRGLVAECEEFQDCQAIRAFLALYGARRKRAPHLAGGRQPVAAIPGLRRN